MVHSQSKVDGFDGAAGHQIIHTPPYAHDATPIERVWMVGKTFAAKVNSAARKPDQLRVDVLEGLYGGTRTPGLTQDNVMKFIRSADDCVTAWIRSSAMLRSAYPVGTATADMTIATYGAQQRLRYRAQNSVIVTFDDATDSSESSDHSDDATAQRTQRQAAAAAAAAASAL